MPIIDPDGLFHGDRLRRCSREARLWWPYCFLASNGHGRLEITYPNLLNLFLKAFHPDIPEEREVMGWFTEYHDNYLIFLYASNGSVWGQWTTDKRYLPKYKTAGDNRSPAPPQAEFSEFISTYQQSKQSRISPFLKNFLKNDEFLKNSQNFEKSNVSTPLPVGTTQQLELEENDTFCQEISEKSAEFSKSDANFGNSNGFSETFQKNAIFSHGIGIGVGVGVGKKRKGQNRTESTEAAPAPPSPGFLTLPLVKGGGHTVTEADVLEFSRQYPAIDAKAEVRKMLRWLNAHEQNRKTPRGIAKFMHNWLGNAQDSAAAKPARSTGKPIPTGLSASERERLRAERGE